MTFENTSKDNAKKLLDTLVNGNTVRVIQKSVFNENFVGQEFGSTFKAENYADCELKTYNEYKETWIGAEHPDYYSMVIDGNTPVEVFIHREIDYGLMTIENKEATYTHNASLEQGDGLNDESRCFWPDLEELLKGYQYFIDGDGFLSLMNKQKSTKRSIMTLSQLGFRPNNKLFPNRFSINGISNKGLGIRVKTEVTITLAGKTEYLTSYWHGGQVDGLGRVKRHSNLKDAADHAIELYLYFLKVTKENYQDMVWRLWKEGEITLSEGYIKDVFEKTSFDCWPMDFGCPSHGDQVSEYAIQILSQF